MSDNEIVVSYLLPRVVNTMAYVRNHHFIRFASKDGRELKLIPQGRLEYHCTECTFEMLTGSNFGELKCPVCHSPMKQRWGREQVCFVPEAESDFEFPKG